MSEKDGVNKKKALARIIAISVIAVIFVPVLYCGIYLDAFWDPYGSFNKVPVAFVNLDKPVVKDGKGYNLGKNLEDNLRNNTKVGWKFVSYEDAKKGVSGTSYYAAIVIPEDFSRKIVESRSGKFIKPIIIYEANKGKNFVFAQVSQRAAESIKSEIASNIQEQITKALASSLYDVKASLMDASEGANKLQSSTKKLADGSKQLSSGLTMTTNGSKQLYDGLKQAASGESQLSIGIDSLAGGLNQFKSSLTQNTDSVSQLTVGAKSLSDGLSAVSSGTEKANLPQGLTATADSISQIKGALSQASSILASSNDQQSIDQVKGILAQLINGINNQNLEGKLRASAKSAEELVVNLNKLSGASQQVEEGTSKLANGLKTTQSKAAAGVNQLIEGATRLKSGSSNLLNGLNTAVQKTGELSAGLTELNTGAVNLSNGINAVNEGNLKLKNGLNNGYNTMNNSLKFTVEDISSFITNPLTLSDISINSVKYYGEGLAPYFISLSLWLGAMLMNLILSLMKFSKTVKYKFMKTYKGTFVAGSVLVMLQAIILSLILINGLGIQTSNLPLFYLGNMFIAVVFFSILYGVAYAVGLIGTPIMFIIFILQLASSGGTFPIETAPKFFRIISTYFPMTYSVEGLRMIISGINYARFIKIFMILLLFMLIFYIGGYVSNRVFKGLKNIKAEAE
jgi:putative membrane protein